MNHPTIRRVVTGHDAQGKALVKIDAPCRDFVQARPNGFIYNIWTTDTHPANNDGDADAGRRPGVFTMVPDGTVFRILDFHPGVSHRVHRTDTIDYRPQLDQPGQRALRDGDRAGSCEVRVGWGALARGVRVTPSRHAGLLLLK